MLPDNFIRLGRPDGPWLEKRTLRREMLPPAEEASVELSAFERHHKARKISILHMGDDRFISWCRLARIATGGFGTVCAAIDDSGDAWVVKKLLRTPCIWSREPKVDVGLPSLKPSKAVPKPSVSDDHTLARELDLATHFGKGRSSLMAFCTPTRAYLVTRAARGDLADVAMMPSACHGQGEAWAEQTLTFALLDVCSDLGQVHMHGMVHNDIKANNVLLHAPNGAETARFVLSDFGMTFSPHLGETRPTHAKLGAPEVLAAEVGACSLFYDLTADDDQHRWQQRQAGDIWSLGLMGVGLAAGQELLERALPFRQATDSDPGMDLVSIYQEFDRVRCLTPPEVNDLAHTENVGDHPLTLACARLWCQVDTRVPRFGPLLRSMLAGEVTARPIIHVIATRIRELSSDAPSGPPSRRAYFERAIRISNTDRAAAIARFWQHGAVRQGLVAHPGRFSPPRRASMPPALTGEISTELLVEPIFRRALAIAQTEAMDGGGPTWTALSPWFDPAYYAVFVQRGRLSLSARQGSHAEAGAAEAYARSGLARGERASMYYDPAFYRLQRPYLAEASFAALCDDYRHHGVDHGVAASADFDPIAFGRSRAYEIERWIAALGDGKVAAELSRRPHLASISFHAVELRHRLEIPSTKTGKVVFPPMTMPGLWQS